jgi:hypothetical protein
VRGARGATLAELLVGTALGLASLALLTAAVAAGGRMLVAAGARGETEDTVHLAVEALRVDVRRAGFDPAAAGVAPLVEARDDGLALAADLDGDGGVATDSEESVAWQCARAARRLSRVVGQQSMPLADGVVACAFRYLDDAGAALATPLGPADLPRVRAVELTLGVRPPGLVLPSVRTALVALRSVP